MDLYYLGHFLTSSLARVSNLDTFRLPQLFSYCPSNLSLVYFIIFDSVVPALGMASCE